MEQINEKKINFYLKNKNLVNFNFKLNFNFLLEIKIIKYLYNSIF
jgi:hypothetical protein